MEIISRDLLNHSSWELTEEWEGEEKKLKLEMSF